MGLSGPAVSARWATLSDAVLRGVACRDGGATRELHRRHAPLLYALAARLGHAPPEPAVQLAFLAVIHAAHRHPGTGLDARLWLGGVAWRVLGGRHPP